MTTSNLAQKIKNLRLKLNMSQDRFGKKVGISGKTVSAYERGACVPPLKVLERVSHVYGTTFVAAQDKNEGLRGALDKLKNLISDFEDKLL